jgi:hypothetical protein
MLIWLYRHISTIYKKQLDNYIYIHEDIYIHTCIVQWSILHPGARPAA